MTKKNLFASYSFLILGSTAIAYFLLKKKYNSAPLAVVSHVDVYKYMGKWFDIAHLPAVFLNNCFNNQAVYSLESNGKLKIVNSCTKNSVHGVWDHVEGIGKITDPTNAKINVEFQWPFKGKYWILEVGKNYDYALVGEPSRQYLWILSRTPNLDEAIMKNLIDKANYEGFSTNNLIMTKHLL